MMLIVIELEEGENYVVLTAPTVGVVKCNRLKFIYIYVYIIFISTGDLKNRQRPWTYTQSFRDTKVRVIEVE